MARMLPLVLLAGVTLSGCANVQSAAPVLPSFPTDTESVAGDVTRSPTLGVAVLDVGIDGLQCAEGRVVLARSEASGFVAVRDVVLPTTYAGRTPVEAVELQPGTYHIVHYTCRNGSNVTYAGTPSDASRIPWTGKAWSRSFAAFTIGPSEVVDVGRLSLKRSGGGLLDLGKKKKGKKGVAVASVAALSPDAVQRLGSERPELAARLTTKAMALAPDSTEIKIARCHMVAEGAGGSKKGKKTSAGIGMVSTSFSGPVAPLTDCVQEGGKSDQFKALVGSDDEVPTEGEGESGQ
ncbi:MAG: hypothetical protein R3D57_09995 [Hyphomicrobiaceae bacterium]